MSNYAARRISAMSTVQKHFLTIQALIVRDLMSRFGRGHLGFIWTVLEPMILCTGVMIIWSFIHEPIMHGMPAVGFVLTGYMPLTLWRHLTGPVARLVTNNRGLLYHRAVTATDLIFSRLLLEFLSTTVALLLVLFVVVNLGLLDKIENPGLALAAWLLTFWFYGASGLIICVLTEKWEILDKFIQPYNYLALPLSGVFFMTNWFPGWAQHLIQLNPSVHIFEMFRAGFFGEAVSPQYNPFYPAAWCILLSVIGIMQLRTVNIYVERN